MHLLQAQVGDISDGTEPVDLGQTPADLVFISAADTELAALSEARTVLDAPISMRLASLMNLQHPLSVDLHLDDCATRSKLVVARVLGGSGYWKYGLEQYAIRLAEAGTAFAALPGDDKPDEELLRLSTVDPQDWHQLWSYLVEGGPTNSANFLRYARHMTEGADPPPAAVPLVKAGVYWPGAEAHDLAAAQSAWAEDAPVVPIIFYRALVQGAGLGPINRLVRALSRRGLNALPIFVASLKDPVSAAILQGLFEAAPPQVILNCTSFAVGTPEEGDDSANPLSGAAANQAPVFQVILSSMTEAAWETGTQGLGPRDIAMNVALPEVDGRILARAISFKGEAYFDEATECPIATYKARGDRIDFVADLALAWADLRAAEPSARKIALVLANYPNKDGRLANGVGLDAPASTVLALKALAEAGHDVRDAPADSDALMQAILAGPTNWLTDRTARSGGVRLPMDAYLEAYGALPWDVREAMETRWGRPEEDPFVADGAFALSVLEYGKAVVGVQPARGYNIDPKETYHAPDLVPPHNYLAFYIWLRRAFGAHVIVHMGKHGNLEWLPGKAVALSQDCFPEVALGPVPHVYPFIVNDPGEGTQAKRRASAVIVDHLTPPLTRAETYGPLKELEALLDEYYEASGVDPRRLSHLGREIAALSAATGLAEDLGADFASDENGALAAIDAYLCELKESQIRDGLHILGAAPEGRLKRDLVQALMRVPRGDGKGRNASLIRAIAADFELGFDPLDADFAAPWRGPRPKALEDVSPETWRSTGDTVERLEELAAMFLDGAARAEMPKTDEALDEALLRVAPMVTACGDAERAALLAAACGRRIPPGPSGAPTRGRLDVLPTGRNFYSVDSRAIPTPAAWSLGTVSASRLIERHLQDHGAYPRALLVTAWGTSNMRTGGDDIAQALALMGAKPRWDSANRRVVGFEILPLSVLNRPRVDITLRVSGFFRDAFPHQIDLVDSAARAIMALDEPDDMNPAAAARRASGQEARVFGSKPGAYGAGLQAMIDERLWDSTSDLGEAYLSWGAYAYGSGAEGREDRAGFEGQLRAVEGIVQNQDNREHDLLDSDDYYQFEGGAAAAVSALQGQPRPIYHNDHSRPENPRIQTLDHEISRVVRARAVNPKWIDGVKRHGYKGAFEIAATVDYLFAFAATTGAVKNHHFDLVHAAYLEDEATRSFIETHNKDALREIAERLSEAIERGLWTPRSNSARALLETLSGAKGS